MTSLTAGSSPVGIQRVDAPTGELYGYEAIKNFGEHHTLHCGIRETFEEASHLLGQVEALLTDAYLD